MMNPGCPSPAEALAIARMILLTRYPGASCAFVAGSIMRGQGTYLSDVDLVVVYDHMDAARRESFVMHEVPVEAFIHDQETLAWFMNEDVKRGRPTLLNMVSEGVIIGPESDLAHRLQQDVIGLLANGPARLTPAALNALRYEITDAVDDLRGDRPASEIMAIGAMLHAKLVELALRGRGRWYGTGKWAPRLLSEVDPALADQFNEAFQALFIMGKVEPLVVLTGAELAPHGGFLFDGDCRTAPASWRTNTVARTDRP